MNLSNDAKLFLAHSIVSQIGGDFLDASAIISTGGPNLISNNETVSAVFPSGPLAGTPATPLDARLAPLLSYGGTTKTISLRPGSPARNAAAGSYLTRDQRGFSVIGVPDLGAYEAGHSDDNFNSYIWETLPNSATAPQHAPTHDYDGDGQPNGDEYLAGTRAEDPDSSVRILSVQKVGQDLLISIATVPGRKYYVERSTDKFATWQYVNTGGPHTAGGTSLGMFLSILPQYPSAYFRVVVNK